MFYAHSPNGIDGTGVWETNQLHISDVATIAAGFGEAFGCREQASSTAMLHDLGKYSEQFQRRLTDPKEKGKDHATAGALAALTTEQAASLFPAIAILGHHVGLDSLPSDLQRFRQELVDRTKQTPEKYTSTKWKELLDRFKEDGFLPPRFPSGLTRRNDWVGDMLDVRMLFSTLVDADFLATETHFNGDVSTPRRPREDGRAIDIEQALDGFTRYLQSLPMGEANEFAQLRTTLSSDCQDAGANCAKGLFTLTAPTGAGKTLAMLRFALEHVKANQLRRIILVMPFLNIIDQTAQIYRKIFPASEFGLDYILESHSLAGDNNQRVHSTSVDSQLRQEKRRRLLAENWDAPIVLTTNVQLLESLFANRPSQCRKLHRLAQSVILFDEVQTLPPSLAVATLAALHRLSAADSPYRTSVVFSTATQPAFDVLSPRLATLREINAPTPTPAWSPKEIVSNPDSMFATAAKRVQVKWEHERPTSWDSIADRLLKYNQSLAIVNLKRHAISLMEALSQRREDAYHLSTNMCSAHRLEVLHEVRTRLDNKEQIRLVGTQCIEAGVDLDFQVVYRAFAPLEAIAQAAGRCNRSMRGPQGKVVVFTPDELKEQGKRTVLYPPGYEAAIQATSKLLRSIALANGTSSIEEEVINSPRRLREYYRILYSTDGRSETKAFLRDEESLLNAIRAGSFIEVAKEYQLIQQDVINVLVPYDPRLFRELLGQLTSLRDTKSVRRWMAQAQQMTVSLYRMPTNNAMWSQLLPIHFGDQDNDMDTQEIDWWYPASDECYDSTTGLRLQESDWVM